MSRNKDIPRLFSDSGQKRNEAKPKPEAESKSRAEPKKRHFDYFPILVVTVIIMLVGFLGFLFHSCNKKYQNYSDSSAGSRPIVDTRVIEHSGTYVFKLKAGESTVWIGTLEERIADIAIASPNYQFIVYYSDGTSYDGQEGLIIPEKRHCFLKVMAKSDGFVTVKIKYR